MKVKFAKIGKLKSGDSVYADRSGGYAIEKGYEVLVEPSAAELVEIASMQNVFTELMNTKKRGA